MSVSEGEGLRNEILSKTHHSPYIVHPGSIKKYKNEGRSGLEFNTYLSSSLLQATFGCHLMKHFIDISVSHPCIGTTLEGDNIGRYNVGRRQCWKGQLWKETTLGPEMIQVLTIGRRMSAS
jgi:hypothetical protein